MHIYAYIHTHLYREKEHRLKYFNIGDYIIVCVFYQNIPGLQIQLATFLEMQILGPGFIPNQQVDLLTCRFF